MNTEGYNNADYLQRTYHFPLHERGGNADYV